MKGYWTSACSGCGHLANVHVREGQEFACAFCRCRAMTGHFSVGLSERAARDHHPTELAWIEKRWPS